MSDKPELHQTTRSYAVYWRARDGQGTHTWKTGLTHAECEAEVRWCEGAHPEASLVWALNGDNSNAHRIRVKETP